MPSTSRFPDATFDCVIVAFGLRNMTHKDQALAEFRRVLRPGGRAVGPRVLEGRETARAAVRRVLVPGAAEARQPRRRQPEAYRYLAESIRMHPDQETLKGMMEDVGLERVEYFNLTGGVVAVHRGWVL